MLIVGVSGSGNGRSLVPCCVCQKVRISNYYIKRIHLLNYDYGESTVEICSQCRSYAQEDFNNTTTFIIGWKRWECPYTRIHDSTEYDGKYVRYLNERHSFIEKYLTFIRDYPLFLDRNEVSPFIDKMIETYGDDDPEVLALRKKHMI